MIPPVICGDFHSPGGDSDCMTDAPRLLIVGDGPVTDALTGFVSVLGWSGTVSSTTPTIGPDVDAVVVTSHHEDVDGPTIRSALEAGTAYVGAMGSRRTQTRRREWLRDNGVSQDALASLHAPIGLDIGADQPAEIAVSILAEIIGTRSGRLGAAPAGVTSIGVRDGAIHPELAAGEAYCPGG
jgi:xanthine/CO dehydrogenase XdhC/CoxF family maturation factor